MTDLAVGTRTVLVTGGAHGIGAAIVRRFATAGHQVLIADTDAVAGAELAEATGARFHQADVSGFADNEAVVADAVAHFGGLDVVCLNAGVPGGAGIGEDFDSDRYRRGIQVNLDGVVYGANAALPALRGGGGAIVVTSSLAGVAPSADLYYSAAKHALIGFVRSLALLVAGDGITVNAICPGFIDTRMVAAYRDALVGHGLAVGQPDHVAEAVSSILAGGGNGQAWQVQGGRPPTAISFPDITLSRRAVERP
ncbi:SDR family NAD(P)-dependent oxidoreductase [Kutzneria sp. CA-103260]|uniref:SDR family NAD(P)-dependent oxidoreductase n=1 Tax=Kutzneria sp. CA-103260 TaxID=2802641 RepID=UPI001BAD2DBF|nr:SDR family oxidoreductase [Kutzneria sp. CA-103260]QUQ65603.1 SDR family NAD(P)-dependent oxidoreductase [Kutzneria sp. CA-103260]